MTEDHVRQLKLFSLAILFVSLIAMLAGVLTFSEFLLTAIALTLGDIYALLWIKS